jgi:hypothetical protein
MFKTEAAKFVYYRTYSRWRDDLGRREHWDETVDRVIKFLQEERGTVVPPKVFRKIEEGMLNFDVLPSMRLVWAAGDAAKADNTTIYNCSFLPLNSVDSFAETLAILCCGTGVGFSVENKFINQLPEVANLNFNKISYKIPDNKYGWADSVKLLMNSLYKGIEVEFDYSGIRTKGSRLKTMGGRSSGGEPLAILHSFIKETFNKAQGRKLTSLECHDIANQIAEIVVVGGVRRSSQISLSDLNDEEMRTAKVWPFPQRRMMANNSAVYYTKPNSIEFMKEWYSLASSGTGERGIFNLEAARNNSPERRKNQLIQGLNPCVTGDTLLLTKMGYYTIDSLVSQETEIWNGFEWSKVTPQITGENQRILKIKFSDGRELKMYALS